MKKLGPVGMKWLKIIHIILVSLFFGGIISSITINYGIRFATYDETFEAFKNIVMISDNVIRIGAVGTLIVGFIYGFLTNWGFIKHRWVMVKWILFIVQTFVGIFIIDSLMMENMAILEAENRMALNNPIFIENEELRQYAIVFQILTTVFIFCISVIKPWKKKKVIKQIEHVG